MTHLCMGYYQLYKASNSIYEFHSLCMRYRYFIHRGVLTKGTAKTKFRKGPTKSFFYLERFAYSTYDKLVAQSSKSTERPLHFTKFVAIENEKKETKRNLAIFLLFVLYTLALCKLAIKSKHIYHLMISCYWRF